MKLALFAGVLINEDSIDTIERYTDKSKITKKYDDEKQEVSTQVDGEPYLIVVTTKSGKEYRLGYKEESKRDSRFTSLAKAYGAE